LNLQREALLLRIQAEREDTAEIGRHVALDMESLAQSRRTLLTGLKLLKASLVAAGLVWSFNASSNIGRSSRLFTMAISFLSTIRAVRKASAFLFPHSPSPERQG
jgi:hypothetical protein